jgi:hypothetical protein
MKKLLIALAALPFMAGAAAAGPQQLNDRQMDKVTAGFTALSIADAEGLVGALGNVLTTTASLSMVVPYASANRGEISSTIFKSLSAAQSSTVTSTSPPIAIPGLSPGS